MRNLEHSSTMRSVTWNKSQHFGGPMSSAALLKAVSTVGAMGLTKSKIGRRASKALPKWNPKLVFEYGPSSYRGLTLHRKIKIAPYAEHFQKKYPDIRVFYHPTSEYNRVCVKLLSNIVCKFSFSSLTHTGSSSITSQPIYKQIDKAIQRVLGLSNSLSTPFRDPICLMTHNLDIDYNIPWYRTQFPSVSAFSRPRTSEYTVPSHHRHTVSFDRGNMAAMHCQVQWDNSKTSVRLWEKFKRKVEQSTGYDTMMDNEAPLLGIEESFGIKKEVATQ